MMNKILRTFFAIPLSLPEQSLIEQTIKSIKNTEQLRWVPAKNWHLTVRFLGAPPWAVLKNILEYIETERPQIKPFKLKSQKIAKFPNQQSQFVAIYVEATAELKNLFHHLDQAAVVAGLRREDREFTPHITLAKGCIEPFESQKFDHFELTVREFILYESRESSQGSEYVPMRKFAL